MLEIRIPKIHERERMTVIEIMFPVVGLVVGIALTFADPVLLSRIGAERAGGTEAVAGSGDVL